MRKILLLEIGYDANKELATPIILFVTPQMPVMFERIIHPREERYTGIVVWFDKSDLREGEQNEKVK